jgi:hypothetical protein
MSANRYSDREWLPGAMTQEQSNVGPASWSRDVSSIVTVIAGCGWRNDCNLTSDPRQGVYISLLRKQQYRCWSRYYGCGAAGGNDTKRRVQVRIEQNRYAIASVATA